MATQGESMVTQGAAVATRGAAVGWGDHLHNPIRKNYKNVKSLKEV